MRMLTLIPMMCLFVAGCHAQRYTANTKTVAATDNGFDALPVSETATIAFPGAEGFGKYTTGGRGGRVYVVNNLNDDGAGSLREAATAKHPRIIVFGIAGTIHLNSKLVISKNATIAGQSAPGGGICIADHPVSLGGDNIIIRYLRFRMGDKNQKGGMVDGNGSDDAFGGNKRKNIIIDHCSASWSTDEVFSVYGGDSTTLQWNIITEPLNYSYHFETGDTDYERHGYGGIWGGSHLSAHHNLFAHCNSRNPRFNGARLGASDELVDYINNVIYDWGGNNVYGGEGGNYNVVANYYKYGPNTGKNVKSRIVNPTKQDKPFIDFGRFYVAENFVDEAPDVTADNSLGVHVTNGDKAQALTSQAFPAVQIQKRSAKDAFDKVLMHAGASMPVRDTLDMRIINEVKTRTGKFIDVQGGYPHGTGYDKTITAWPSLPAGIPAVDADNDGMPDAWEKANGLNATDAKDASLNALNKHYTNIEVYLNSLIKLVQ